MDANFFNCSNWSKRQARVMWKPLTKQTAATGVKCWSRSSRLKYSVINLILFSFIITGTPCHHGGHWYQNTDVIIRYVTVSNETVWKINWLFTLFHVAVSLSLLIRVVEGKLVWAKWLLWMHLPIFTQKKTMNVRLSNEQWRSWFSWEELSVLPVAPLATVHATSNEILFLVFYCLVSKSGTADHKVLYEV
jgi:hypothetical protein